MPRFNVSEAVLYCWVTFWDGADPVPEVGRDSAKLNKSISIWIYFVDKQSKGVQMRDSIYFSLPTDTLLMHI